MSYFIHALLQWRFNLTNCIENIQYINHSIEFEIYVFQDRVDIIISNLVDPDVPSSL